MRRSRQVGEAFFAIYPRTNQPRMKLSAGRDEDWYRYSSVMALLRVGSEQPAMHCGRLAFTASLHEHRPPTTLASAPPLCPDTREEDQQAGGTAPASSPLDIPVPSRSLRTPESAYHSLLTEGRARSPEVGEPRFGGQRSRAPAKQEHTSLLRTGSGPRLARWPHAGTSWSKSKKGEVSMAFRGVSGKQHSPASVSPPSFPSIVGEKPGACPLPATKVRDSLCPGQEQARTSSRCWQGLGETATTQAKPVKRVLQSNHAQSCRERSFMG